nr:Uncharacterised protein [Raoultella sp. NCTC 9187]
MLKMGDEGIAVAQLVDDLRKLLFGLAPGNKFDALVKKSVEAFQVANVDASGQPLVVDGKVGPHTRWALDAALGKHSGIVPHAQPPSLPPVTGGSKTGQAALKIALAEVGQGEGRLTIMALILKGISPATGSRDKAGAPRLSATVLARRWARSRYLAIKLRHRRCITE